MRLGATAIEALAKLDGAAWFRNVGNYDLGSYKTVRTWKEALAWSAEGKWSEVRLEWANELGEILQTRAKDRYRKWNVIVLAAKPIVEKLARQKCSRVVDEQHLPKTFEDDVRWDILHCVVEAEYSDVVEAGRYAQLATIYENGHWPCGWQGTMKKGQVVIF